MYEVPTTETGMRKALKRDPFFMQLYVFNVATFTEA
jgi:hypothetical protein